MKTNNSIKTACLAIAIIFLAMLTIDAQIQLQGTEANHEGIAAWDADGKGDEAEASGHHFSYGGYNWYMAYYVASRDYNNIDPHSDAALCRFTNEATGFPNLKEQVNRLGFSMDQLKLKSGISSLGKNIEGKDWGVDGNIHWYRHYGNSLTIELAGQPILLCHIDTNYCFGDLDDSTAKWRSYTSFSYFKEISSNVTKDGQIVARAFLKDLDGRPIKISTEGTITKGKNIEKGRDAVFHEIKSGSLTPVEIETVKATHKHAQTQSPSSNMTFFNINANNENMMSVNEISTQPNPFRSHLKIVIEIVEADNIKLEIYNFVGKKVAILANSHFQNGKYEFNWDASGMKDGIYFCCLQAGDVTITKKLIKTK